MRVPLHIPNLPSTKQRRTVTRHENLPPQKRPTSWTQETVAVVHEDPNSIDRSTQNVAASEASSPNVLHQTEDDLIFLGRPVPEVPARVEPSSPNNVAHQSPLNLPDFIAFFRLYSFVLSLLFRFSVYIGLSFVHIHRSYPSSLLVRIFVTSTLPSSTSTLVTSVFRSIFCYSSVYICTSVFICTYPSFVSNVILSILFMIMGAIWGGTIKHISLKNIFFCMHVDYCIQFYYLNAL